MEKKAIPITPPEYDNELLVRGQSHLGNKLYVIKYEWSIAFVLLLYDLSR